MKEVRWKQIGVVIAGGLVVVAGLTIGYDKWRTRDGWCARFHPDGSSQVLYGRDCWK